jgi:hypothetical protein
VTNPNGVVTYQYAYHPHGDFQTVEDGSGVPSGNRAAPAYHKNLQLGRETTGRWLGNGIIGECHLPGCLRTAPVNIG